MRVSLERVAEVPNFPKATILLMLEFLLFLNDFVVGIVVFHRYVSVERAEVMLHEIIEKELV